MGQAIHKAVIVAEILRRRVPNLEQVTDFGHVEIEDHFEPIEEGLDLYADTSPVGRTRIHNYAG